MRLDIGGEALGGFIQRRGGGGGGGGGRGESRYSISDYKKTTQRC